MKMGHLVPLEPLLPILEPQSFQVCDAALIKGLAFLDKKKVGAIAKELRAAATVAAATLPRQLRQVGRGGHAQVSNACDRTVVLSYRGKELSVAQGHFQKLRSLYEGNDETGFADSVFCCLLRYQSVLQKGFQGACTREVFTAVLEAFGARFECFASPLNCRYNSMCSAFPDTDEAFGSLGSFFALNPQCGSFQLNPPFVDDVIIAMVKRLEELLDGADANQNALTFVVIVGANEGSRSGSVALGALRACKFCRASTLCHRGRHQYYDGDQHSSEESCISPCDTAVFVLQSKKGHQENAATDIKMKRIEQSFEN